MNTPSRSSGFTLLELIVVVGIFAVFAAMAYGGLDGVLKTRVHVEERLARTEEYDRAYLRMRSDFQNASMRGVRGGDGEPLPSFSYDNYTHRVELTRGGWQNLLNLPRASLERVSYFLDDSQPENTRGVRGFKDKRLVRRSWYVLDRAPQTQAVEVVLLDHVEELDWRFLDESRTWQDSWGSGATSFGSAATAPAQPAPRAVEIKVRTKDWGELKFLFMLGAEAGNQIAKLAAAPPTTAPPPGGNQPPPEGGGEGEQDGGGNKPPPPPPAP